MARFAFDCRRCPQETAWYASAEACKRYVMEPKYLRVVLIPEGPKYLTLAFFGVSILGIVRTVLGRYLMADYLDP